MNEYIGYSRMSSFKVAVRHLNESHIFIVADPDNDHAVTKENGILYDVGCLTEEGKRAFFKDLVEENVDWNLKTFKLKEPVKPLWYLFGMFGVIQNFPKEKGCE